jgi:cysteine-rich repeat protein
VGCGDGVGCTDDSCDEINDSCLNTPNDNNCPDDGLFCTGQEICDAQNDCSSSGDPCPTGTVCEDQADTCEPIAACGNGILEPGEECDDGNVLDGDGCAADCKLVTFCTPAPDPSCAAAERGQLDIAESKPGAEKLKVSLTRVATETLPGDLGDPVAGTTSYEVCLYDAGGSLVGILLVDRAGDTCGDKGRECWKAGKSGFTYKDADAASDGISAISAKSGAAGKGGVSVRGGNKEKKGQTALPTGLAAALNGSSQAEVQVVTSDAQCFGATMTPSRDDGSRYQAKTQ